MVAALQSSISMTSALQSSISMAAALQSSIGRYGQLPYRVACVWQQPYLSVGRLKEELEREKNGYCFLFSEKKKCERCWARP
jgi:hypothetical protein